MSHSVTITRTTTSTTNTSYIVLNTGYLKTLPGLLKLFELLIGAAIVGIFGYYYSHSHTVLFSGNPDLFLYLMATTFMIGTFCLLLSCLTSLSTGGIISKTIYELIYHSIAGILLLISALNIVIALSNSNYRSKQYDTYMAAGILGLINSLLYFISAFMAHRSYRGI